MADQNHQYNRILILCATELEMGVFLDRHAPSPAGPTRFGGKIFSGSLGKIKYTLLISGPGVFNTALALGAYLEHSVPDLILDTGIAGVFPESGLGVGDIGVAVQERYIHTGVGTAEAVPAPLPFDLIPDLPSACQGIYPMDRDLVEKYYGGLTSGLTDYKTTGAQVAQGEFITVSLVTGSGSQARKIHAAYSPIMEAMEGAAAAHTAFLYKVPFLEIRAGSNVVGERDKSKWNIPLAADRVCWICEQVLS